MKDTRCREPQMKQNFLFELVSNRLLFDELSDALIMVSANFFLLEFSNVLQYSIVIFLCLSAKWI